MSISPLITFKAGICDFDVGRDLSLSLSPGIELDIAYKNDFKQYTAGF